VTNKKFHDVDTRAESYKTELKDAETLKYKLENKVGGSIIPVRSFTVL